MGSEADLDVVRRMIELQFKLMNDDPEHLYRAPTSVQPNGTREYHVRRNSQDNKQNAAMFPLTGDIEVIEEVWHYYEARKDAAWLRSNVENLEHAAGWILSNDANAGEFERFPSFLAAKIADYDKSEIGDGGPYDLCAAGRCWFWDAAYYESKRQGGILLDQLKAVAAESSKDNYFMSERYDMDHVYYIDGKNAHGAEEYYEYPNTFTTVLIAKYLGLTIPADADLSVAPLLKTYGSVEFVQCDSYVRLLNKICKPIQNAGGNYA
jgi:hypothetical protein